MILVKKQTGSRSLHLAPKKVVNKKAWNKSTQKNRRNKVHEIWNEIKKCILLWRGENQLHLDRSEYHHGILIAALYKHTKLFSFSRSKSTQNVVYHKEEIFSCKYSKGNFEIQSMSQRKLCPSFRAPTPRQSYYKFYRYLWRARHALTTFNSPLVQD